jgi:hypothetical protein
MGILAILAVEGPVSRDHLMALLWPESDTSPVSSLAHRDPHLQRQVPDAEQLVVGGPAGRA